MPKDLQHLIDCAYKYQRAIDSGEDRTAARMRLLEAARNLSQDER